MPLSKFDIEYLLEARQEFENQIFNILVQINFENKSIIVQPQDKTINLVKTYQLRNLDSNYQQWIDNFKFHLLSEQNKKINTVDIPNEHRSFNQKCASCNKPNPYGDLNCSQCYQDLEIYYDQQSQKYEKSKIKR